MDISKAILIVGLAFVVAYSIVNRHVYVPQAEKFGTFQFSRRVNVFTGSDCYLLPAEFKLSGKGAEDEIRELDKNLSFCD